MRAAIAATQTIESLSWGGEKELRISPRQSNTPDDIPAEFCSKDVDDRNWACQQLTGKLQWQHLLLQRNAASYWQISIPASLLSKEVRKRQVLRRPSGQDDWGTPRDITFVRDWADVPCTVR